MNFSGGGANKSVDNSTNSSNADGVKLLVNIVTWCTISSIIATLVFNALILAAYMHRPSLRTPFNVYIANLAITEIILALTAMPGSFVRVLYGYWPFDAISCSFLIYTGQGFGAAIRYCHILITANRFWAVTFPVSYKIHHSERLAKKLVVIMWILVHALNLPVIIRGRLEKGTAPLDRECFLSTKGQYQSVMAVELLSFTIPECLILLTYLFIALQLWKRRRAMISQKKIKPLPCMQEADGHQIATLSGVISDRNASTVARHAERSFGRIQNSMETGDIPRRSRRNSYLKHKSHNRILAYLVIAVVFCWTPNHVFYLLVAITGYWNQSFFAVQYFAQYANSWLNPILIYLADAQFRAEINTLVCYRS